MVQQLRNSVFRPRESTLSPVRCFCLSVARLFAFTANSGYDDGTKKPDYGAIRDYIGVVTTFEMPVELVTRWTR